MKDLRDSLYEAWDERDEGGRGKTDETDFSLKDQTIWCHTHRMYFIGFNSIRFPWFIPKDFPRDALKKQDREKLVKFIDEYNQTLKFNLIEKYMFIAIKILYPPIAKMMHQNLRKKKFVAL